MKRFPRKHDRKIFLFGYQASCGSEVPIAEGEGAHANMISVHEQNRPYTMFNTRNVRHLFLDGDGSYNSGPLQSDEQKPCIVSGAFFNELDPEVY